MGINKPNSHEPWEFENEKLRKSLPGDVVCEHNKSSEDEKYQNFLLTLAVIFNDLKDLAIIHDTIVDVYRTPKVAEISGHVGEKEGIRIQLTKLLLATLFESLIFLRDSKEIYESERVKLLVERTTRNTKLVWEMLINVAQGNPIKDEKFSSFANLYEFLKIARNNVGFHYQNPKKADFVQNHKLADGYRKFFFQGIANMPTEQRKWAYRSTGKTSPFKTRYYYADAALQGYYIILFGDEKLAEERADEVFELAGLVMDTINYILIEYHASLPNR